MRSPRLVYLAVAAVLAVAGFGLTHYLADRSAPGLGDTVVVPAGASVSPPPPGVTPSPSPSTPRPSAEPGAPGNGTPGAEPVTPGSPRTAGDDDDQDDDLDDTVDGDD